MSGATATIWIFTHSQKLMWKVSRAEIGSTGLIFPKRAKPSVGGHSDELLRPAGCTDTEIGTLRAESVIAPRAAEQGQAARPRWRQFAEVNYASPSCGHPPDRNRTCQRGRRLPAHLPAHRDCYCAREGSVNYRGCERKGEVDVRRGVFPHASKRRQDDLLGLALDHLHGGRLLDPLLRKEAPEDWVSRIARGTQCLIYC